MSELRNNHNKDSKKKNTTPYFQNKQNRQNTFNKSYKLTEVSSNQKLNNLPTSKVSVKLIHSDKSSKIDIQERLFSLKENCKDQAKPDKKSCFKIVSKHGNVANSLQTIKDVLPAPEKANVNVSVFDQLSKKKLSLKKSRTHSRFLNFKCGSFGDVQFKKLNENLKRKINLKEKSFDTSHELANVLKKNSSNFYKRKLPDIMNLQTNDLSFHILNFTPKIELIPSIKQISRNKPKSCNKISKTFDGR